MKTLILPIKRKLQRQWKALRFQLSASNHPLFIGFYRYLYAPGKGSLSEFLHHYSQSKKGDFTVIQVGANDGITHDPIHKFIKRDRWKGVLLEPQPQVFHQFLKEIYAKNEGITPVCAAIGEKDGTQPIYKIGFSDMRWATGLSSFSREKIESAFEEGIVAANCMKFGMEIPEDREQWISQEEVEVIAPRTLMQRYGISKIDLLQVDAEGYDLEVIRIFDLPNSQPAAVVFENVGLVEADYASCLSLLEANGYGTRKFGPNTLALKKDEPLYPTFFAS
ncbi:FkbM family methyltransferase [Cyclobacterium xiamenense]|jgi:FkbM family methyltransferase|uniref:FkbM family methyltransferase n=1 Tax=Cyclobacterium xiamenense TaxID=1297121 RepID=UPI0035CEF4C6